MAALTLHELENTFGVLFIGYIVAMVLYGFTFFQTYVYFSRYSKDSKWLKALVAFLCALDTTTSGLISQALYHYLVILFPFPVPLTEATPAFCAENGLGVFATLVVQLFYAWRVRQVSGGNLVAAGVITVSSLTAFAFGITMTVHMFADRTFTHLAQTNMKAAAATSQGVATLADIFIVAALCYYLTEKRNPAIRPYENWFDQFVTLFISRGIAFTAVQAAYFITFIVMPDRTYWMPFHHVISKLYINSLLTLLNSRESQNGVGVPEEQTLSTFQRGGKGTIGSVSATTSVSRTPHVRYPADSKQSINIEVSQTIQREDAIKQEYDDDAASLADSRPGSNKGTSLAPVPESV